MTRRSYKTKWHRYCTILAVILVALGGLIMLLYGVIAFLGQNVPDPFFLATYIDLGGNLQFLWSVVSILVGVIILITTVKQKPHVQETREWMMVALLLGILGGTLGGLIAFGGGLIYFIMYFL
jgi:hypothetical protein